MTWKIALAGLGAAARRIHLPAYARIPDLAIVGGCDPAVRDEEFGFPVCPTLEELLDRFRPDILAVTTPPESHYELTRQALEAGCHVFCEKPFMTSVAEARDIIARAKAASRRVIINNQYRFMNIYKEAKRRIGTPSFGDLLFLSAHQTFLVTAETEAGWRGQDPRRTCKEFGTHVLDLCRFFFDEDPRSITARMPRGSNPQGPDYLNLILLEFSGDRVAQITLDRICRGPHRYLILRLDGSTGCLETRLGGRVELSLGIRGVTKLPYVSFEFSRGGCARLYQGEKSTKIASDPGDIFAHASSCLLRAFLEALARGEDPPCDAEDNVKTLALMLAAYESDERRVTIAINQ